MLRTIDQPVQQGLKLALPFALALAPKKVGVDAEKWYQVVAILIEDGECGTMGLSNKGQKSRMRIIAQGRLLAPFLFRLCHPLIVPLEKSLPLGAVLIERSQDFGPIVGDVRCQLIEADTIVAI